VPKQQLYSRNFCIQPLLSTEGSKNPGSWLLLLASLPSLDKWESQGAALTLASWPSSRRDSPPTVKVSAWHCPAALPLHRHGAQSKSWSCQSCSRWGLVGAGASPAVGHSSLSPLCCLGCSRAAKTSAGPTYALNCRVNVKVVMADRWQPVCW